MKKRNLAIAGMLLALLLAAGCGAKTAETASPSADTAVSASPSAAASEKAAGATVESLKLADGQYQADVKLSGGSGRASITSPGATFVLSRTFALSTTPTEKPARSYSSTG